jgi:hypothetical protein
MLKQWIREGISRARPALVFFPDHWRPDPNTGIMEPVLPARATQKGKT